MARTAHNALDDRRVEKLDDKVAQSLRAPTPGESKSKYWIYWCETEQSFGLRVSENGKRSWILQCYDKDKKLVRRTLGSANAEDPRHMKVRDAIVEKRRQQGLILHGEDKVKQERELRRIEAAKKKVDTDTLSAVLREYVTKKRKSGGIPLKERTVADYLKMVEAGGLTATGRPRVDGELYVLADRPITSITGEDIRTLYEELKARGRGKERRAGYAMQVLRAVLNWAGIKVPDNPLGRDVAGRQRIVIASTKQAPNPIPAGHLGRWWYELAKVARDGLPGGDKSKESADYLRFKLLTGCRGVEIKGDEYGNEPIRVSDVDGTGQRIVVRDTKNRRDHVLLLSRQAIEVVERCIKGKKSDDLLFDISYPRKTLRATNKAAGLSENAHDEHSLRDTFASIADELVSTYTLKMMLNHATSGDVTGHYVGKGEAQLRAGWQAVADLLDEQAKLYFDTALAANCVDQEQG